MAEKRKPKYIVKTRVTGAKGSWLQQQSKKAPTEKEERAKSAVLFLPSMPRMPS